MDVREHLRNGLRAALAEAGIDPLPDDIALERPANRDHGDWSSNIALATAKTEIGRLRARVEHLERARKAEDAPGLRRALRERDATAAKTEAALDAERAASSARAGTSADVTSSTRVEAG